MTKSHWSRRSFLGAAAAVTGATLIPKAARGEASGMHYRALGNTGLKVSEIGFGGYPITDANVVRYAIDRGITYFDTAWMYRDGISEQLIGEAVQGRRDKVVITTKWHPMKDTRKADILAQLDTSLRRLKTDYVDCLLVHEVGFNTDKQGMARLHNPELYEAYEAAHKAGKYRFAGVSGHDGDLMSTMKWVIDSGRFQVILNRYNFLDFPEQQATFHRARERGLGCVAMKSLAGAKGVDLTHFRNGSDTYARAALKWVLSNPDVSTVIISITSKKQVDEYVQASGSAMTEHEHTALAAYRQAHGDEVCRFCNLCEPSCPEQKPIAYTLRHLMYAQDYGEARGVTGYRRLPASLQADSCLRCDAPCKSACPHGVAVGREMRRAARVLADRPPQC
jgi:aryl-alcohol dehydrogenase-like predicted oxidoreductase